MVVQHASAVSVTIAEEFGLKPGKDADGQMVGALRKLGFKRVFDTSFTADLTIMEEGSELVKRIQTGGTLPMMTSCSPGWIKYVEQFYPDFTIRSETCWSESSPREGWKEITMANVKKILVVDDDPDIVEQVTMILKQDGHEVHSAGTQDEAEEILLSLKPDLAILDLMREDKDSGFVLCHRIKKVYPNTPVMMVTAVKAATGLSFAADSALQQSWLKADLLVDKPIRAEVLRNDVNGLLNRAAAT